MDFLIAWLEANAVLLGSLAAVATIATLFLVNGTQILGAFFLQKKLGVTTDGTATPTGYQAVSDRPSIAFLPLTTMASDPEIEHLADGIIEDAITQMARIPGFFVISRNSTFVYKSMPHDPRQIGRDLSVRYLVEGSVRKVGENLRVTVQLISTETGDHVWAGNSDLSMAEVMEDPDRITRIMTASLQPQIMMAEALRAKKKPVEDLTVWELIHYAFSPLLLGFESDSGTALSVELARRAIALDPENARAKAALAWSLADRATSKLRPWETAEIKEALEVGQDALRQDRADSVVLYCWAYVLVYARHTQEGIKFLERALEINPYDAQSLAFLGFTLVRQGKQEEGLELVRQAMTLSPEDPRLYMWHAYMAMGYFSSGHPDKAVESCRSSIQHHPVFMLPWVFLAAAEAFQGHDDEAMEAVREIRRLDPDFSFKNAMDAYMDGTFGDASAPDSMQPLVALVEQNDLFH